MVIAKMLKKMGLYSRFNQEQILSKKLGAFHVDCTAATSNIFPNFAFAHATSNSLLQI